MSHGIVSGSGYEGKPGHKHRIFARHHGKLLPMLWFRLGKDGSLYIGPYVPNAASVKVGSLKPNSEGVLNVPYEDGMPFSVAGGQATKASFHPSGVIHLQNFRAFRNPFEEERSTFDLCFMAFAAPDQKNYKAEREIRKWDIVSGFNISDDHPVYCQVRYSVGLRHTLEDAGIVEWKTFVQYSNLDRIGSACIEIALCSASKGTWPPYSYMVAAAEPDAGNSSKKTDENEETSE